MYAPKKSIVKITERVLISCRHWSFVRVHTLLQDTVRYVNGYSCTLVYVNIRQYRAIASLKFFFAGIAQPHPRPPEMTIPNPSDPLVKVHHIRWKQENIAKPSGRPMGKAFLNKIEKSRKTKKAVLWDVKSIGLGKTVTCICAGF